MAKQFSGGSCCLWLDTVSPGTSETLVAVGNFWLNTVTNNLFVCKDATFGAQVWDEYPTVEEESSYTPTLTGSTVTGSTTYTLQKGFYTTIGKRVFLDAIVQYTAATGTGNMQISLPIPARNTSDHNYEGSCSFVNINLPTNAGGVGDPATNRPVCSRIDPGSSSATFFSSNSGASGNNVSMASPSAGTGTVRISVSYLID